MSEEGQVTDEGQGEGTGEGEGEAEGSTLLGGGEGEGKSEDKSEDEGEGTGEGESEDEGESQVPENYEFNMPEGMELDQALADAAVPVFKELGLNQDQADQLTGLIAQARTNEAQASADAFAKQLDDWGNELKKDETFGGDSFDENASKTFDFIEKTMPAELKEHLLGPEGLFDKTGIGQHPALVKYFYHLSQKFPLGEDDPGSGDGNTNTGETPEARLYPNEAKTG